MRTLKIRWQRLVSDGQTCPRCDLTGEEVEKAVSVLRQVLAPLGVEVALEKSELSFAAFRENPLESNRVWIEDKPLEEWLDGKVGRSSCCDVCGPYECRTVEVDGEVYETITADLIVKAGLLAASKLIEMKKNESCCRNKAAETSEASCCSQHTLFQP
ncbi:MAG: DUF2703 domain-containing protein [Candidatus Bathyarchaeia archaeon]